MLLLNSSVWVEKGLFPQQQANDHDLNLDVWIPFIEQKRREGIIE